MAQVRVEYITLGTGGKESPLNVIRGSAPKGSLELEVTDQATAAGDRPRVPSAGNNWGQDVRLTAIGTEAVYVDWGRNPTATKENSMRLVAEVPEVIRVADGDLLSFITGGVIG